jgi:type III restriction enzyme
MELKLEELEYQRIVIQSVVKIFDGTDKNTFDNACIEGIRSNRCNLTVNQIAEAIKNVVLGNEVKLDTAQLSNDKDLCIEMETGTGKTLVYIKTIYELFKHYGFTKFIILVPSVAIRQGVLGTFKAFNKQLENIYGFKPNAFPYDSKRLNKVTNFIQEQHPQVMIMTLASFNSEDKILNQAQREDLFSNIPFIEAIGRTKPIIIMDEPQEGMDTPNALERIHKLNPLFKIRYSATHKIVKNLIYRLTPYDSYKQGLVKKIEILTVTEKNDEATLKIQLAEIQHEKGKIRAKFKAWHQSEATNKIEFKMTNWLSVDDNLGKKTNNPSYLKYQITQITKSLISGIWIVRFSNGVELFEKQAAGNVESIWAVQLDWLIHRHFMKSQKLAPLGIKCLSLIFIDKVANYMSQNPVIKNLFMGKYKAIYPEYNNGEIPNNDHIKALQGYYFAQKSNGEYADTEGGIKEQSKIYELILKGKEELLTLSNPVQFIFSHSALGVGWDNPNVFNIATLNTAYSDIRKRQEIGRGLRICVNQNGQRIYDPLDLQDETHRINQLTVVPNESYETFVTQYQNEIRAVYGSTDAGANLTHSHKGELKYQPNVTEKNKDLRNLSLKTMNYYLNLDEQNLIDKAVERINALVIPDYIIEATSFKIEPLMHDGKKDILSSTESRKLKPTFAPLDMLEVLCENTGLAYTTLFKIVEKIENYGEWIKNPPRYMHDAAFIIRNIIEKNGNLK